jgi:hypothetical protein
MFSVDPGLATGVALMGRSGDVLTLFASAELGWPECADAFEYVMKSGVCDVVIAENFIINARTVGNSQAPWSLMALGCVTWLCDRYSLDLVLQLPSNAKNVAPNEKLKRLGTWHKGGAGHANDAIRHAVLYAISTGFRSPALVRDPGYTD